MKIVVLGSAAGGGFPQWNSNAAGCRRARAGDPKAAPRTQASIAVSQDGVFWFVFNASPDIRQQIEANAMLHPNGAIRSTPIAGVVLTNGDVDALAGLLTLRERQAFTVYATSRVHGILNDNPIFEVLARDVVERRTIPASGPFALTLPGGEPSGLTVEFFPVPGKVPLYLEQEGLLMNAPAPVEEGEQTVGAAISDGRRTVCFIPACAMMTDSLRQRLAGADTVFFDGTLWSDDEMIRAGLVPKTGRRMGHMSVSGEDGTIAAFRDLGVRQKILIHINNSNPVLLEDSAERAEALAAGWTVAHDGMQIEL
ncbi:pyrroloquinoline quinone biosynthesis protein PqqB [Granulibacter bethesdensis]|nr:pyrroloquinoline quinone biosynthesis protein PqqB [Granulibacter bethesdensis]